MRTRNVRATLVAVAVCAAMAPTTAQFTALATAISHRDLTRVFHTWLYTAGKPSSA